MGPRYPTKELSVGCKWISTLNHFTGLEIHRKTCRLCKWGIQFEEIGSVQVFNNIYTVSQ